MSLVATDQALIPPIQRRFQLIVVLQAAGEKRSQLYGKTVKRPSSKSVPGCRSCSWPGIVASREIGNWYYKLSSTYI